MKQTDKTITVCVRAKKELLLADNSIKSRLLNLLFRYLLTLLMAQIIFLPSTTYSLQQKFSPYNFPLKAARSWQIKSRKQQHLFSFIHGKHIVNYNESYKTKAKCNENRWHRVLYIHDI